MTEDNASNLANEVISRLDDIFKDDGDDMSPVKTLATAPPSNANASAQTTGASKPPKTPENLEPVLTAGSGRKAPAAPVSDVSAASPLVELNAIVLSLDWEISDDTLGRLLNEIDRLKAMFADEKLLFMFLQVLSSIGKYISMKKVKAHPDSIKLLHSVFTGLDRVLNTPNMAEVEKKRILVNEVRQFKNLKERIRSARIDSPRDSQDACEPAKDPEPSTREDSRGVAPLNTEDAPTETSPETSTTVIVAEMQKAIRAEFAVLRDEIRQLLGK